MVFERDLRGRAVHHVCNRVHVFQRQYPVRQHVFAVDVCCVVRPQRAVCLVLCAGNPGAALAPNPVGPLGPRKM